MVRLFQYVWVLEAKLIKESSLLVLCMTMMKLLYVPFGTPTPQNKSNHGSTKLANPVVGAQTRLDFLFFLSSLQSPWIVGSCCHWSPQSSRVTRRDRSSMLDQWITACCWQHQARGHQIYPHSGGGEELLIPHGISDGCYALSLDTCNKHGWVTQQQRAMGMHRNYFIRCSWKLSLQFDRGVWNNYSTARMWNARFLLAMVWFGAH